MQPYNIEEQKSLTQFVPTGTNTQVLILCSIILQFFLFLLCMRFRVAGFRFPSAYYRVKFYLIVSQVIFVSAKFNRPN